MYQNVLCQRLTKIILLLSIGKLTLFKAVVERCRVLNCTNDCDEQSRRDSVYSNTENDCEITLINT